MKQRSTLPRFCILAALCFVLLTMTIAPRARTAGSPSISGRVTNGGKPIPGLELFLQRIRTSSATKAVRVATARSNAEGRYTFHGVDPGIYEVATELHLYVRSRDWAGLPESTIEVPPGSGAINFDLTLVRAGRISGTITDAEGHPYADQYVQLDRLEESDNVIADDSDRRARYLTDKRGDYTATGLPPGRYRVSSGLGVGSISPSREGKPLRRTFHPDTVEARLATVLELNEGDQIKGVDIRMTPSVLAFAISGQVVDSATGEGVSDMTLRCERHPDTGRPVMYLEHQPVQAGGEFRFEGLRPGRYHVVVATTILGKPSMSMYAPPLDVEIIDSDMSDLQIRLNRGTGEISGEVVTGPEPARENPAISRRSLMVMVTSHDHPAQLRAYLADVASDGRFTVSGLMPGKVRFDLMTNAGCPGGFSFLRTEGEGGIVSRITIGPGENISGVRLVFTCGRGSVQGSVLVAGRIPAGFRANVISVRLSLPSGQLKESVFADEAGKFVINGLLPGDYLVEARIVWRGHPDAEELARMSANAAIRVFDGAPTEVTLTITIPE